MAKMQINLLSIRGWQGVRSLMMLIGDDTVDNVCGDISSEHLFTKWEIKSSPLLVQISSRDTVTVCLRIVTEEFKTLAIYAHRQSLTTSLRDRWQAICSTPYSSPIIQKKVISKKVTEKCKLWSQTRKKRLKKSKNVFSKCVLDFNFAPIKGSVFFIFKKKVKFVVP